MSVTLLNELTMPAGRFAYWLEPGVSISTPLENVPPLGSARSKPARQWNPRSCAAVRFAETIPWINVSRWATLSSPPAWTLFGVSPHGIHCADHIIINGSAGQAGVV